MTPQPKGKFIRSFENVADRGMGGRSIGWQRADCLRTIPWGSWGRRVRPSGKGEKGRQSRRNQKIVFRAGLVGRHKKQDEAWEKAWRGTNDGQGGVQEKSAKAETPERLCQELPGKKNFEALEGTMVRSAQEGGV